MNYKRYDGKVIVRLDTGEEIVATLKQVCQELHIKAGSITGIGAIDQATIGWYDLTKKQYHATDLVGNYEITSLCGNISTMNDQVYIHLHITLADDHYRVVGGHLTAARISATGECFIDVVDGELQRATDKKVGLNLLQID